MPIYLPFIFGGSRATVSTRLFAATLLLAASTSALAQSAAYSRPNITTHAGSTSATLGGQTFVNQGLVGAGRLGANTLDFRGETLGSLSGMAMDLSKWRRNADGSYAGSIFTLPDRGPFDGAIDYRNRVVCVQICVLQKNAMQPFTSIVSSPLRRSTER